MEKQSYLPIKFFHKNGVQDYENIKNYSGDVAIPKYPAIAFPGFQLVMPDTPSPGVWALANFDIYLINYDSGTEWIVLNFDIKAPVLYDAGTFWILVLDTFPWESIPTGIMSDLWRFYYRVDYNDPVEVSWESEVFEICNLDLDVFTEEFTEDTSFASFASVYEGAAGDEYILVQFCETGGGVGNAVTPIECFPGEEFDVYIRTLAHNGAPACGSTDWAQDVFIYVRDSATGKRYSEEITLSTINTLYYTRLTVLGGSEELTGELELFMEVDDDSKGRFEIWMQRTWKAEHIQLRYTNERNFCKIVYEDDYETRMFLNAKQVIDNNQLEENVVEDDQSNKYRIIGTNQKWNSVQFAGGESLLNAMSLLRLHDDITIVQASGEPMDVVEVILEQTIRDDYTVLIKLVYREDSCSWTYCPFTTA